MLIKHKRKLLTAEFPKSAENAKKKRSSLSWRLPYDDSFLYDERFRHDEHQAYGAVCPLLAAFGLTFLAFLSVICVFFSVLCG